MLYQQFKKTLIKRKEINKHMVNMISKDFDNLMQRSIYYFLATFPTFTEISSPEVTESEQKNAYNFIKSIYEKLYINPALLGLKPVPDDSFGDWEQQKAKPNLSSKIRSTIKKVDENIYNLSTCFFWAEQRRSIKSEQ
jgi:hypothetical protein